MTTVVANPPVLACLYHVQNRTDTPVLPVLFAQPLMPPRVAPVIHGL